MKQGKSRTRLAGLVGAALLLGGMALSAVVGVHAQAPATATPASNLGGPAGVPSARFYGTVTGAGGSTVVGGTTVTATIGGVACGVGTVSGTTYVVDVQAIAGCTASGATVSFTVGGQAATQTGTLPPVEGTAVNLNLTVATATPTPAPATATVAPPPPPPPPATTTATVVRPTPTTTTQTTTQTSSQKPVAVTGQKPVAVTSQKPVAVTSQQSAAYPAAQRPGAAAAYPAARVQLPNTGAGSTAGQSSTTVGLLSILLGALALGATGLAAYRRSR